VKRLLLLLLLAGCATAPTEVDREPVRVRASVASAEIAPSKPFVLTVEVDRRDDVQFSLPDPGAKIEGLVVMDVTDEAPQTVGNRVVETRKVKLKAPLSGTYLIPGVEAPWRAGDEVGTAGTGPILLQATLDPGTADAELKPLKALARPDRQVPWGWLVGLALLAAVAAGVRAFLRRGRAEPEVVVPPHETALAQLAALGQRVGSDAPAALAWEVSAILRRYLEARYGFPAWRMTTPEMLRAMPPELGRQHRIAEAIRQVLEASDYVKFAGQHVESAAAAGWIEQAVEVVQATQPVDEEEAA
jgi:hypothetical protein